jgi:hypothetical protein
VRHDRPNRALKKSFAVITIDGKKPLTFIGTSFLLVPFSSPRYQSDQVDNADGRLLPHGNRSLRAAILGIADNLIHCNHHFQHLAMRWADQGKDPRDIRVRVAMRFCRIAFQMVAGRQVLRHPCIQGRHYILDKLNVFHREHDTGMADVLRDLKAAIDQVPPREYAAEAKPLQDEWQRIQDGRRRGPQMLGDILPIVFARLRVGAVQSTESGEWTSPHQVREPRTPFVPKG